MNILSFFQYFEIVKNHKISKEEQISNLITLLSLYTMFTLAQQFDSVSVQYFLRSHYHKQSRSLIHVVSISTQFKLDVAFILQSSCAVIFHLSKTAIDTYI